MKLLLTERDFQVTNKAISRRLSLRDPNNFEEAVHLKRSWHNTTFGGAYERLDEWIINGNAQRRYSTKLRMHLQWTTWFPKKFATGKNSNACGNTCPNAIILTGFTLTTAYDLTLLLHILAWHFLFWLKVTNIIVVSILGPETGRL